MDLLYKILGLPLVLILVMAGLKLIIGDNKLVYAITDVFFKLPYLNNLRGVLGFENYPSSQTYQTSTNMNPRQIAMMQGLSEQNVGGYGVNGAHMSSGIHGSITRGAGNNPVNSNMAFTMPVAQIFTSYPDPIISQLMQNQLESNDDARTVYEKIERQRQILESGYDHMSKPAATYLGILLTVQTFYNTGNFDNKQYNWLIKQQQVLFSFRH